MMKSKTVSICCFTSGMQLYAVEPALVAVDVIRATTTATTAVSTGRKCHLAPTLQAALETASRLPKALLAGELGGDMPAGFDLTNSPAELAGHPDISRPLVLLSSTGTRLMYEIRHRQSAYLACFRNYTATIEHLARSHNNVLLIGAGTRGEFREEDQMCCAWIAQGLIESGFVAQDEMTSRLVERWRGASQDAFMMSRSVDYLRRTHQLRDLDFILSHFDDIDMTCKVRANTVSCLAEAAEV
jgi:2-phosphosulfolactate phosphatase